MDNIRNSVDKREIIKYLKLREGSLHRSIFNKKNSEKETKILKIRQGEICRLLDLIKSDRIREENKKTYKYISQKLSGEKQDG